MLVILYMAIAMAVGYITLQFYLRRSWIGLVLVLAFTLRTLVCLLFLSDYQQYFVLDGHGFEFEAWELAKSWSSSLPDNYIRLSTLGTLNFYKYFLAGVFFLFGKEPLIGMLLNTLFSCLTIFLLYKIVEHFFMFSKIIRELDITEKSLAALMLTFYPSYIIWSSTNIRDPLYFLACALFFYCLLSVFSRRSVWHFSQKLGGIGGLVLSVALILGIRFYIGIYFAGSVLLGMLAYRMVLAWGVKRSLWILGGSLLGVSALLQWQFPEWTRQNLQLLDNVRQSFSNAGYEDVAQSSFALDYEFNTVWDLWMFIPIGLVNYFFGPFFWNITSFLQGLAQVEVLLVYVLAVPTLIGIHKAYKYARFETVMIVVFCFVMAMLQSVTISNLGTLFRHRTLDFILLSIFAGVGLMEIRRRLIVRFQKHAV